MTKVYMILTMLFWASAFVGIRYAVAEYNPFELALFRYMVASMTLFIVAIFKKIRLPNIKDLSRFFVTGIIGISVYNILVNYGELTTTASEACFIVNMAPLFTTLMGSYFLKEKIRLNFVIGLIISFLGVSLIAFSFSDGIAFKQGSLFILIAAIAQAIYFILQKPLLKKYTPLEVTCYCLWSGAIAMVPFGFSFVEKIWSVSPQYTFSVIYLGIFPAAMAYLCWAAVLSTMDASKASSFLYCVPVIVILIGWLWLDELPSTISIIGGSIAISGVICANMKKESQIRMGNLFREFLTPMRNFSLFTQRRDKQIYKK
ncbi:MAG: EamA family transporter [Desulfobacteraceae bacterium]|nr:EamA family transporter [Desulfobacteraceae bacterium]